MPKGRKTTEKTTNNSVAQRRRGPGAPRGNRNALRHGRRSAAYLERRRLYRAELRELMALAEGFKALCVEPELQARLAMRIAVVRALSRAPPPL